MSALDLDALERRARKGIVLNPDETLALITRLRAAEARTAWQPMETAPMTMDYILTHGPRGHVVARYCSALGWVDEDDRDVYFSHWQPLPAPSASEVPRD